MMIATIMDYPAGSRGEEMCKAWIYFAKRSNPKAEITIFHERDVPGSLALYASRYPGIHYRKLSRHGVLNEKTARGRVCEGMDYKLAFWKDLPKDLNRFIFVDADAWIFSDLSDVWKAMTEKPYAAVLEAYYPRGPAHGKTSGPAFPTLNTGVFWYYSDTEFLTYEKLLEEYHRCGDQIDWITGDQGLVNSYLARLEYSWTHPALSFEYNTMAWTAIPIRMDHQELLVLTGDRPNPKPDMSPNWVWWGRRTRAKILHAFWKKWWELPEMRPVWNYGVTQSCV